MKEGTANWGVKWSPGGLQICCQNGSKFGVEAWNENPAKSDCICDPGCGVTFDPTKAVLTPQVVVSWCSFMLLSASEESTSRSWLLGCKNEEKSAYKWPRLWGHFYPDPLATVLSPNWRYLLYYSLKCDMILKMWLDVSEKKIMHLISLPHLSLVAVHFMIILQYSAGPTLKPDPS